MTPLFISYARRDACWAERLDTDLQRAGYHTWRDKRDIDPNQDFTGEIEAGIRAASHVVVCLTPDVQRQDSFVRREIQYALGEDRRRREQDPARRLPLVPVVFPGGELPVHISTWTALFLQDKSDYDRLFSEVLGRLRNPDVPDDRPVYTDRPETVRYLRELHEWCSQRLAETVMHLLTLGAKDAPGLTRLAPTSMFRIGFVVSPAVNTRSAVRLAVNGTGKIFGSLEDAFHAHGGRILLLGAPGAGKTTTLLAFARDAAVARLSNPSEPLPVLASIHRWDHRSRLRAWLHRVSPWPKLNDEQLLFLLDGLDELGGPRPVNPQNPKGKHYDPRARFLDVLARDLPTGSVVVTSRDLDYREIGEPAPLNAALTLQPLSDAQVRDYLAARDQAFLWDRVERDPEFAALVRTPLLLGMLSLAIGQESALEEQDAALLDEGLIFDRYISRRFVHEASKPGILPFDEKETRAFLATLAVTMWLDSEPGDWMTSTRWLFAVQRASLDLAEVRSLLSLKAEQFLEFCVEMHLLRKERDGKVAFQHFKLRDFCALPALFELAQWTQGGELRLDENPLRIDFTPYPPELIATITQSVGWSAIEALRLISRSGIDLIQATRRLNATSGGAGAAPERRLRYSSSPDLSIPDNDPTGVRDTIHVPNTGLLADISIELDVQHAFVGDLVIQLRAPGGAQITLQNREGGGGKAAWTPRTSVLDPSLKALRGKNCQGEWTLEISDRTRLDTGVLHSWALDLRVRS